MQSASQLVNETVNETRVKTKKVRGKDEPQETNKSITSFMDEVILRSAEETLKFFK
ncbi:hypothetical protein [Morganella morganii]|uniref:hypothetical protein n=1 Tax=Morganella morganii TaxID=582 RepID=UPI00222ECF2A|nr:hypothetical protein [Morganella morganii]MDM8753504.1 hypothetical protein [Morganella morganii]